MRPGLVQWATNSLYAGGAGVGQPTKAPATAGQVADGYYPDILVAPQIWNYERWAAMQKSQEASSIRVLNWVATDLWAAGLVGTGRGDGVYDPSVGAARDSSVFLSQIAAANLSEAQSIGGLIYAVGAGLVVGGPAAPRLAVDAIGGQAMAVGGGPPLNIQYRAGLGAWGIPAQWAIPPSPVGVWALVAHNWIAAGGGWVMCDSVPGGIEMIRSTGPAAAFVACGTPPGFAGTPADLIHTHHPAGTVYPQDPGNQVWLALSNAPAEVSRSTSLNGDVWSAAAASGIPNTVNRVAYSAAGARFIAAENSAFVWISDDNGVTWTGQVTPLSLGGPATQSTIACDGFGDWVVAATDGTTVDVVASYDNGATWRRVFMPVAPVGGNIALWYGGGRFHLMTDDGVGNFLGYTSLRGGNV